MAFHYPSQIFGFHSCDREVGLKIINGKDSLKPSLNSWDWLGGGIYFWEQNPGRALEYAEECAKKTQFFRGEIKNPFVIGAIINLGNCLNLLESKSAIILKQAHKVLGETKLLSGTAMPKNKGANRALDCAVIQTVHQSNKESNSGIVYDTIRSSFAEGGEVYPGSIFTDRLHIEVCVINPDMILGYYLPQPVEKYNPYLNKDYK